MVECYLNNDRFLTVIFLSHMERWQVGLKVVGVLFDHVHSNYTHLGVIPKPCWHGRRSGILCQMSKLQHKPYSIKWSTKGGQNCSKNFPRGLWMTLGHACLISVHGFLDKWTVQLRNVSKLMMFEFNLHTLIMTFRSSEVIFPLLLILFLFRIFSSTAKLSDKELRRQHLLKTLKRNSW